MRAVEILLRTASEMEREKWNWGGEEKGEGERHSGVLSHKKVGGPVPEKGGNLKAHGEKRVEQEKGEKVGSRGGVLSGHGKDQNKEWVKNAERCSDGK